MKFELMQKIRNKQNRSSLSLLEVKEVDKDDTQTSFTKHMKKGRQSEKRNSEGVYHYVDQKSKPE
jgi:hypothetical protein